MLERVYAKVSEVASDPLGGRFNELKSVFGVAINVVVGVAVSMAVIFIGLGGIQYISAKGDAKAADAARASITNAVIGLVIALGALAVKAIVTGILDANTTNIGGNLTI